MVPLHCVTLLLSDYDFFDFVSCFAEVKSFCGVCDFASGDVEVLSGEGGGVCDDVVYACDVADYSVAVVDFVVFKDEVFCLVVRFAGVSVVEDDSCGWGGVDVKVQGVGPYLFVLVRNWCHFCAGPVAEVCFVASFGVPGEDVHFVPRVWVVVLEIYLYFAEWFGFGAE